LRNDAEAEETLQTVFFDVFRSIHQFDASRGSFKTWLLLFAYHRAYNHRRLMHARRYENTDAIQDLSSTQLGQVNLTLDTQSLN
jgi:RNA polymerase sigma-70 factor (ECF subfamily)